MSLPRRSHRPVSKAIVFTPATAWAEATLLVSGSPGARPAAYCAGRSGVARLRSSRVGRRGVSARAVVGRLRRGARRPAAPDRRSSIPHRTKRRLGRRNLGSRRFGRPGLLAAGSTFQGDLLRQTGWWRIRWQQRRRLARQRGVPPHRRSRFPTRRPALHHRPIEGCAHPPWAKPLPAGYRAHGPTVARGGRPGRRVHRQQRTMARSRTRGSIAAAALAPAPHGRRGPAGRRASSRPRASPCRSRRGDSGGPQGDCRGARTRPAGGRADPSGQPAAHLERQGAAFALPRDVRRRPVASREPMAQPARRRRFFLKPTPKPPANPIPRSRPSPPSAPISRPSPPPATRLNWPRRSKTGCSPGLPSKPNWIEPRCTRPPPSPNWAPTR